MYNLWYRSRIFFVVYAHVNVIIIASNQLKIWLPVHGSFLFHTARLPFVFFCLFFLPAFHSYSRDRDVSNAPPPPPSSQSGPTFCVTSARPLGFNDVSNYGEEVACFIPACLHIACQIPVATTASFYFKKSGVLQMSLRMHTNLLIHI